MLSFAVEWCFLREKIAFEKKKLKVFSHLISLLKFAFCVV
jgi:hypothetical protein